MATTLMDMISRVRSNFKLVDADNLISNRVVADEVIAASIKLIKQQVDKRRLFSSSSIFTQIPCLEMQQVPLSSCCNYQSQCMIARSIVSLPKIGNNIYGPLVQGVYSIDGSYRFTYADPDRFANLLKIYPHNRDLNYFWLQDGYLYITNPNIETVRLLAFFEEPLTVGDYSCSGPQECPDNPIYLEFKCPGYLLSDVANMARMVIERDYKRSEDDKTVDQNDTSK